MLVYDNKKLQNYKPFFSRHSVWFFIIIIFWGVLVTKSKFWAFWSPKVTTTMYVSSLNAQKNIQSPIGFLEDLLHFRTIRNEYYQLKTNQILNANNLYLQSVCVKPQLYNTIQANALISDIEGASGIFIINKGRADNVKVGMNITLDNSVLVGRVVEVFDNYAKVESLYSPNINISVINSISNEVALVKRDNKGFLKLTLFSDASKFKIGDPLVTSLDNKEFLRGLLVGQISNIVSQQSLNKPDIFIDPFFKLPYLNTVYIITTYP